MISSGVDPMTTKIVRVGNTLSVEIPEELVALASLPVGEPVEWVSNGSGGIALVRPSGQTGQTPAIAPTRMTLEELLEGIPEGAMMQEIDWGPPRGVEFW
jgi:antitoxin component of MazEF toxin-antitoxin module